MLWYIILKSCSFTRILIVKHTKIYIFGAWYATLFTHLQTYLCQICPYFSQLPLNRKKKMLTPWYLLSAHQASFWASPALFLIQQPIQHSTQFRQGSLLGRNPEVSERRTRIIRPSTLEINRTILCLLLHRLIYKDNIYLYLWSTFF